MQMLTNQNIDETKTFLKKGPKNQGMREPRIQEPRNQGTKKQTQIQNPMNHGANDPITKEPRGQETFWFDFARDARCARPNQEPKDQGAKKTMNQASKEPMNVLADMLVELVARRGAASRDSTWCTLNLKL